MLDWNKIHGEKSFEFSHWTWRNISYCCKLSIDSKGDLIAARIGVKPVHTWKKSRMIAVTGKSRPKEKQPFFFPLVCSLDKFKSCIYYNYTASTSTNITANITTNTSEKFPKDVKNQTGVLFLSLILLLVLLLVLLFVAQRQDTSNFSFSTLTRRFKSSNLEK